MGHMLPMLQEPKYFVCNPANLCEGASCCRSPETQPTLSLGDYFRLSQLTGETMESVWRTKGDVDLYHKQGDPYTEFYVHLGLLHDPCPYLTDDSRCGVYSQRPLACGLFPFTLFEEHHEQIETIYQNYRCLQGIELSPRQKPLS